MAATVHGNVNFGLTAETGLYVENVDHDFSVSEKWVANEVGDDEAGALYNPQVSGSLSGVIRSDESITTTLGAAITVANVATWADYITGYTSGGLVYLKGAKPSLKKDDFEALDLSFGFKPFLVPVV